jgi:N-acetyl-anhydromuramyl-L-alanine amidase AmpD
MRFVEARNYTKVATRQIDLVVIHTMESPEKPDTAEGVANWFHNQPAHHPPEYEGSSCHYCIDNNSIVQCVHDHDVAWAAPGANHNGLQFEHAGRASQRASDWRDGYSIAELLRSAELCAKKCVLHGIPVIWRSPADLVAGKRGITSHANVSAAFRKSTHTDPGPNFPAAAYIRYVRAFKAGRVPAP